MCYFFLHNLIPALKTQCNSFTFVTDNFTAWFIFHPALHSMFFWLTGDSVSCCSATLDGLKAIHRMMWNLWSYMTELKYTQLPCFCWWVHSRETRWLPLCRMSIGLFSVLWHLGPLLAALSVPPRNVTVLQKLVDGSELKTSADDLRMLSEEVSVLFYLLKSLEATPMELCILIEHLLPLSKAPFVGFTLTTEKKRYRLIVWVATFLHCQICPVDSCYTQDQYREKPRVQVTLHILPSLLISRHILPFQDRYKEKPECKSRSTSHPSLFPGKFCLFCQHSMLTKIDNLYYFILYIDSNLLNHGKR